MASVISGAPMDLQSRTVRIYKPTKPATQSGNWNGRQWRMDWDVLPRGKIQLFSLFKYLLNQCDW